MPLTRHHLDLFFLGLLTAAVACGGVTLSDDRGLPGDAGASGAGAAGAAGAGPVGQSGGSIQYDPAGAPGHAGASSPAGSSGSSDHAGSPGASGSSSTAGTSGAAATCDQPGVATTPVPTPDGSATSFNVTPEACTLTATALGCALGATHQYTATVVGAKRVITTNGIPDHDVGAFPNPGNPHAIAEQHRTYEIPLTPAGAGQVSAHVFGVLLSGAPLDPTTAETWNDDPSWSYEALRYTTAVPYFSAGGSDKTFHPTSLGVDCNLAHVQPGGTYHYHGVPMGMLPATPAVTHVGWAADGYPIIALHDHADAQDVASAPEVMRSSWRIKAGTRPSGPGGSYDGTFGQDWEYQPGSGDLDECNGRVGVITVEGQAVATYHYVLTQTFPFVPRCWHAAPDPSFTQSPPDGGGGGTAGQPGNPPPVGPCAPGQHQGCCGDGECDGPETHANCASDCG